MKYFDDQKTTMAPADQKSKAFFGKFMVYNVNLLTMFLTSLWALL